MNLFPQKQKRWKWVFGKMRNKRLATLTAPLPPKATTTTTSRLEEEEEEEERKQALSVAIASTAAAEAAVAAAKAAVEVVWLTGTTQSHQQEAAEEVFKPLKKAPPADLLKREREIHEFAAITIQTAFRGFLVSTSSDCTFCLASIELDFKMLQQIGTATV